MLSKTGSKKIVTQTKESMISTTCRVCNKTVETIFSTVLLQKHPAQFFKCSQCGYVQTEEPYWLEEAYKASINDSDTGIMMRSFWHRNIASTLIYFLFDKKRKFLLNCLVLPVYQDLNKYFQRHQTNYLTLV